MAETAISAVLLKLGELAVNEAKILLQVGDDIILLRDRLEWLQAVVRDSDRRRWTGTDGLTQVWVRQTRDVAFEAEDALDDYFHVEVVSLRGQGFRRSLKASRRYITCLFTKTVVRHGLSDRIKIIKSRLDQISVNQKEYNIMLTSKGVLASSSSTTAVAAWRDDMQNTFGFNRDVEIIKKMMDGKRLFISIVGESGAGKNTLAKIISRRIQTGLEVLVWYHMEPGSSIVDLLAAVYQRAFRQCYPDGSDELSGVELILFDISQKLADLLSGKNYLLILGGISSKAILNCVRASLPDHDENNENGGHVMLILDTEYEEVAWHANTMNKDGNDGVHLLNRLDESGSADLFFWKVLKKRQNSGYIESEGSYDTYNSHGMTRDYYRGIVELVQGMTGGYPMVIVLLAGLLRFKDRHIQWDLVLKHLVSLFPSRIADHLSRYTSASDDRPSQNPSDIGNRSNDNETTQVLSTRRAIDIMLCASFEDLPTDIKSCYLYFAAYPKDTRQYADEIVRIWIGEGFIKPQNGKTMEEVGQDYLKELVLRCLIEVEDMKASGGIQLVRVHKSLTGFLQSEVQESGFMEIHTINDAIVPSSVRRLSVQSDNGSQYGDTFTNSTFNKLRSFICHVIHKDDEDHHQHDLKLVCRSKFIRVISVRGLRLEKLPDQLGDMIHLRYLRVDSKSLHHLPSSIAKLLNLQTLDISNTEVEEIDKDFWKIKTLRHVLATDLMLPVTMPDDSEAGGCGSKLQTLHGVKPAATGEWSAGNCPLDRMKSLQSLEIHGFQFERHDRPAFWAALGNMPLLAHLNLKGDKVPSCVFTDPSLRNLETMVLHGNVTWNDIVPERIPVAGHLLRKVRPNLIQIKVQDINQVPELIKEQLGTILIKGD